MPAQPPNVTFGPHFCVVCRGYARLVPFCNKRQVRRGLYHFYRSHLQILCANWNYLILPNLHHRQRRNNAEYERVCQICAGAYESAGKCGIALGGKTRFLLLFFLTEECQWLVRLTTLSIFLHMPEYLLTVGNEPIRIAEVTAQLSKKGYTLWTKWSTNS